MQQMVKGRNNSKKRIRKENGTLLVNLCLETIFKRKSLVDLVCWIENVPFDLRELVVAHPDLSLAAKSYLKLVTLEEKIATDAFNTLVQMTLCKEFYCMPLLDQDILKEMFLTYSASVVDLNALKNLWKGCLFLSNFLVLIDHYFS
jgi:hypothetical protein